MRYTVLLEREADGGYVVSVLVRDHKQVRRGTLRRIIADVGLTVDEFIALF